MDDTTDAIAQPVGGNPSTNEGACSSTMLFHIQYCITTLVGVC